MLKKEIREEEIIDLLNIYYGIDTQAMQFISDGADINAFAYKVDTKSNSYFVKFKYSDQNEINLSIVKLLHDSGIKEIIFPINTIEGKLFQQLDHFSMIVYPFIHAPNGFNQNLSEKQWERLGKAVRKIHDTPIPTLIQKQLRKETYSSKWREIVRSLYNKIDSEQSDDQITATFKSFFKRNINRIQRIVDSSAVLSEKIQPDLKRYVLCHSDIHAGNILVANDASIYIIDWDESMLAPKERDLMFIGGGVGNVWNKPQEIHHFYKGYGRTSIDTTILSYYRHERIVEDVALYGKDLLLHDQSDQSRREMLNHFKAMFDPNGVVEIALASN